MDEARGEARRGTLACGGAGAASIEGQASPRECAPITDAQWLVLFLAELGSIAPAISDSKSFALGARLLELRAVDRPERAAASVAVGLGLLSVH